MDRESLCVSLSIFLCACMVNKIMKGMQGKKEGNKGKLPWITSLYKLRNLFTWYLARYGCLDPLGNCIMSIFHMPGIFPG